MHKQKAFVLVMWDANLEPISKFLKLSEKCAATQLKK